MNTQQKIAQELESQSPPLGAVGTVNELGFPQIASVYYVSDDALNIFFITRSQSRKYKNICRNHNVSFVVTSEHPPKTIQLEGIASKVVDVEEQVQYYNKLTVKATERNPLPPVNQIVTGELVLIKITILWARFGDFEIMKEGKKFIETKLRFSNDLMRETRSGLF